MAVLHIYKIVICKGCGAPLDVEYLGPALNLRIAGTVRNPGQVRCSKCGGSNEYFEKDTRFTVRDYPPNRRREAV
jgi:RNase P subunit RPR2